MVSVQDLTVDFGNRVLFKEIGFVLSAQERVALVGKNGAGKSTLLKLLAGREEPTSGSIDLPKDLRIGYLPQVMHFQDSLTVLQEVETVFAHHQQLEEEYQQLTHELALRTDHESASYVTLIERHAYLLELLQFYRPEQYQAEIEKTLLGLGFEREDFGRPTSEFSGGWRMRIELAKVLLAKPDLLLLDEPTNHLDIESILWLENFLISSGFTLLLISHDRTFLDAVTKRTIEIELGHIYDYKTYYSHYLELRKERVEQQKRAYENQQKEIEKTTAFIEKFRYKPTKSVQVQNRIKQLQKMETIEVEEQDLSRVSFRFLQAERSGDYPVIVEDLGKSYGSLQVLSNVSLTLQRGEKVAFVGKNGAGKSTLVKCLMGEITDYTGTLKIGHGVKVAYFSQNRAQELPPDISIRTFVDQRAHGDMRLHINDILGAFMFGGETADKPIGVLSGGERSRVALIELLLEPANLLILDEPTNHLDLASKEVLKEAIAAFGGSVIVVSHDRYFLDGLVDKVYEFAHGSVREKMGGMQEFLMHALQAVQEPQTEPESQASSTPPTPTSGQELYRLQKEHSKKIKQAEKRLKTAEERVFELEESRAALEQDLATGVHTGETHYLRYAALQKELALAEQAWEDAANQLCELQQTTSSSVL